MPLVFKIIHPLYTTMSVLRLHFFYWICSFPARSTTWRRRRPLHTWTSTWGSPAGGAPCCPGCASPGPGSTSRTSWSSLGKFGTSLTRSQELDIGISLTGLVNFVFTIWLRSPCAGENDATNTWIITKPVNPTTLSNSRKQNWKSDPQPLCSARQLRSSGL